MSHKLFDDFHEVSAKAWKQKIQYDLKGADYNEALVWESLEGIKVKPFYHSEDTTKNQFSTPFLTHSWKVGQTIYAGNAARANEKVIKAIERGVESIQFIVPSDTTDISVLLKNINVSAVPIYLKMDFLSSKFIKNFLEYIPNTEASIFFNVDIIENLARSGNWYESLAKDHELLLEILKTKAVHTLSVDIGLYENAGADMAQQLGYACAQANEYLNYLEQKGQLQHLKSLVFKVAIGGNYFFEIAKLRALRMLWKTVSAEYGLRIDCHIMAEPSKRNKTLYDYNVNMLRTTTECMSAILGGANTIFNRPYDSVYHKDNEFGERISVNQLLLLKEESYFDKVANAADGSYYIETITSQLAEKGLRLFKSIEKGGGFLKQLKGHAIQNKIKESAKKQQERFNSNEEVLVGTNKFQNSSDRMKQELELYPFVKHKPRKTIIAPIIERRLAEALEQNRLEHE